LVYNSPVAWSIVKPSIARTMELTDRFFRDHPGYPAIFLDVQSATPELLAIEAEADARLIADWAGLLVERAACEEDAHLLAYVLVKTVGHLLWLAATQEQGRRDRLVAECGELALAYLRRRLAGEGPPG
jgi:hypothetical protein